MIQTLIIKINLTNKMNVILLFIWFCVLILTLLNVYYNNSIIVNYQNFNEPKITSDKPKVCTNSNIPTVQKSTLTECGDGFSYKVDDQDYKIVKTQASYSKVCSHFCDRVLNNGKCTNPIQNQKYQECENLFKPDEECNSSIKPAVYVQDGTSKTLYYPEAPILTQDLCSTS